MNEHPIQLVLTGGLERSRLTVFFRGLLAIPHLIWLTLWSYAVAVVWFIGWIAAIFLGRLPEAFHRFESAFLRYSTHVSAYWMLAADPFPGFMGEAGYPVDLSIPSAPEKQNRLTVLFRVILAIPAALVVMALLIAAYLCWLVGWFAALILGRMPGGLQKVLVFFLQASAQLNAYMYLLTGRYPQFNAPEASAAPPSADPPPAAPTSGPSVGESPA